MTYYPTLDEDLARAKEILAKAGPTEWELRNFTPEVIEAMRKVGGGAIGGSADIYAAYKLLESFVEHIEEDLGYIAQLRADNAEAVNWKASYDLSLRMRDETLAENDRLRDLLAAAQRRRERLEAIIRRLRAR